MPVDYSKYPPNWHTEIRPRILKRADHKCEWCGVPDRVLISRNGKEWHQWSEPNEKASHAVEWARKQGVTLTRVILTIAHLDHDNENHNVSDDRLAALCQRCHLQYDAPHKAAKRKKDAQGTTLFDVETRVPESTCKKCIHLQRHECSGKVIMYCGVRTSGRTFNGLLKIKANDPSCPKFKGK